MNKFLAIFSTWIMMSTSFSAFANFIVTTPDHVIVTQEALFVDLDGSLQVVDSIVMANDGYVVAVPNPEVWYCDNCGKHVVYPIKNCPRCGNPNPKNQR